MFSKPQLALKYLKYFISAQDSKGHGMHSPFVYDFVVNVLNDKRTFYSYAQIEKLRQEMLTNNAIIEVEDMGAGSTKLKKKNRSVAQIAKASLKPSKYGKLFFRMIDKYQPQTIVELGTSLGITASYMATANPAAKVITMEGAKEVAAIAQQNFNHLNLKNIELVEGNFDNTLAAALPPLSSVDLAFIDGNHRLEPTINYFEQLLAKSNQYSIIILDDIHWSKEMEQAWEIVKQNAAVTATIDLFFIGIVLLRKEFKEKQHFTIRF